MGLLPSTPTCGVPKYARWLILHGRQNVIRERASLVEEQARKFFSGPAIVSRDTWGLLRIFVCPSRTAPMKKGRQPYKNEETMSHVCYFHSASHAIVRLKESKQPGIARREVLG